ncbi:hypothetical protein [Labilibacter marinus]|uniref:hypothetical protein n=1 Tax=Labilibacter marinus TaxID=1477105 RepID=UPI00082CCBE7|nr:hypothetical protein [Labilibacter marinus]
MLSKEEKLALINDIIKSKTFQKATTSSALLKYLVKAEIEDTFLKEDIIDLEFFGKKGKSDKSNTRVRVSMYNLRKKLSSYYEDDGKDNTWIVKIDKGQYSIRFEKKVKPKTNTFNLKDVGGYALLSLIILLLLIDKIPPRKPRIWKDFLYKDKSVTLFIGDAFGMKGKTITGSDGFTRDYTVNSIEEYYSLLEQKPELKEELFPAHYQYFTGMGVFASRNISQLFTPYNKEFDIKFNSNTSLDDIKNGNAIYAGPLLTKNKFIPLFNDANEHFNVGRYTLEVKGLPNKNDTILNISSTEKITDYAIVSKYPGPMGTKHFVFFSNHDMGVSASIEYFTNKDSVKYFTNQYLENHKYFTALFKAHGRERTSLKMELLWVVPF